MFWTEIQRAQRCLHLLPFVFTGLEEQAALGHVRVLYYTDVVNSLNLLDASMIITQCDRRALPGAS